MKKFTTKQLAIALLAIAFAFIIGLTTYRGVTGQFKSTPAVTVQTKKTKKKKIASVTKEEKKEATQTSSDQTTSQDTNKQETDQKNVSTSEKKETTASSQTDTANKQTTTPSKTETKKNTNTATPKQETQAPAQTAPVKQTISIKVIGINETMMSGDIEVNSSSTAYSVLKTLAKQNNKTITTKGFGSTVYVSGIDGLKEFDHGPSSGWMYKVNGTPPNIGSGAYKVKAGDTVIWYYVNVEK